MKIFQFLKNFLTANFFWLGKHQDHSAVRWRVVHSPVGLSGPRLVSQKLSILMWVFSESEKLKKKALAWGSSCDKHHAYITLDTGNVANHPNDVVAMSFSIRLPIFLSALTFNLENDLVNLCGDRSFLDALWNLIPRELPRNSRTSPSHTRPV